MVLLENSFVVKFRRNAVLVITLFITVVVFMGIEGTNQKLIGQRTLNEQEKFNLTLVKVNFIRIDN